MLKLKLPEWLKKKSVKKEPNLYKFCNTLPIHNFNEISNNNDFSYLKIDKKDVVSDIDLQNCWLEILEEYLKISNNKNAFFQLNQQSSILLLETRLRVLECFKNCVQNEINIDLQLLEYKIEKQTIDQRIGLIKNDLAKFYSQMPVTEKSNTNDFEQSIAIIMENGYSINRFKTVVSEYVAILNRIETKIKNQNERH